MCGVSDMETLLLVLVVQAIGMMFLVLAGIVNASRLSETNWHLARISRGLSGLDTSFDDFIQREAARRSLRTTNPNENDEDDDDDQETPTFPTGSAIPLAR